MEGFQICRYILLAPSHYFRLLDISNECEVSSAVVNIFQSLSHMFSFRVLEVSNGWEIVYGRAAIIKFIRRSLNRQMPVPTNRLLIASDFCSVAYIHTAWGLHTPDQSRPGPKGVIIKLDWAPMQSVQLFWWEYTGWRKYNIYASVAAWLASLGRYSETRLISCAWKWDGTFWALGVVWSWMSARLAGVGRLISIVNPRHVLRVGNCGA